MLKLSTLLRSTLSSVMLSLLLAAGSGCKDSSQSQGVGWQPNVPFGTLPPGFDSFPERWNKQINDRLAREEAAKQKEIRELRDKFFKEEDSKVREKLQSKLIADEAALSVIHRRQTEGDYIKFKTPADIPQDLKWEDGLDNPEIGDPNAKKGGVLRQWAPGSYPDTFRPNGPNSNSGFRGPLYDEIIIGLVSIHPVTGKIIPGIAHKWAESPDRRTVYVELDPDARYTDGAKVKAIDLLVNMYIRTSEYSRDVFYNNFFYQNASNITIYDDSRFSITLPFAKPLLPYYCTLFIPSPPHFYCEFGPNYVERYQWRIPPTTGAYVVKPDGIIRGRQVTLQRVPDWWARDKKFTKYMYNVDQIVYNFIAEPSKAIELFRIGELDVLNITKPELWHERMEIPEVHNGYINRSTFYTIYPRPPYGVFLNTSKAPFNDLNVRRGVQHALNIQNIIDITFRGDYQRLNSYNSGFGKFTNPYIKARPYSPEQARAYFARAGYTIPCPDGILRKPDGTRLTAAITFPNSSPSLASTLGKLKEDARKCGLEIQLDPLDSTVAFRKIMEKRAQASFMAWGYSPQSGAGRTDDPVATCPAPLRGGTLRAHHPPQPKSRGLYYIYLLPILHLLPSILHLQNRISGKRVLHIHEFIPYPAYLVLGHIFRIYGIGNGKPALRGAVYHMGRHHGGAGKCPIFHQFHGIGRSLIAVTAYETVHLRVLAKPLDSRRNDK